MGRYSFICQGTSTRRQRSDLFGLRVKLFIVDASGLNGRHSSVSINKHLRRILKANLS